MNDDEQLAEKIMEMIHSGYMLTITAIDGGASIIGEKTGRSCSVIYGGDGSEHPAETLLGMLSQLEKVLS